MSSELQNKVFSLVVNRFRAASKHTETLKTLISQHAPHIKHLNGTMVQQSMKVLKKHFSKVDWAEVKFMFKSAFVFMVNESRPDLNLKEPNDLLKKYPEFANENDEEKFLLFQFRNYLISALRVIDPKNKKGELIGLVGRICGAIYVTGGGQTTATDRRVMIFERETGIEPRKFTEDRKRKTDETRAFTAELIRKGELTKEPETHKKVRLEPNEQLQHLLRNQEPADRFAQSVSSVLKPGDFSEGPSQLPISGEQVPFGSRYSRSGSGGGNPPVSSLSLPPHLRLQLPPHSALPLSGVFGYEASRAYAAAHDPHSIAYLDVRDRYISATTHNPYAPYDLSAYKYPSQVPIRAGQSGAEYMGRIGGYGVRDVEGYDYGSVSKVVMVDAVKDIDADVVQNEAARATTHTDEAISSGHKKRVHVTDSPSTVGSTSPRSVELEEVQHNSGVDSLRNDMTAVLVSTSMSADPDSAGATPGKADMVSPLLPSLHYPPTGSSTYTTTGSARDPWRNPSIAAVTSTEPASLLHTTHASFYHHGMHPSYLQEYDHSHHAHHPPYAYQQQHYPQQYALYSPQYAAHPSMYPQAYPVMHPSYMLSTHYAVPTRSVYGAEYVHERERDTYAYLPQYNAPERVIYSARGGSDEYGASSRARDTSDARFGANGAGYGGHVVSRSGSDVVPVVRPMNNTNI